MKKDKKADTPNDVSAFPEEIPNDVSASPEEIRVYENAMVYGDAQVFYGEEQ